MVKTLFLVLLSTALINNVVLSQFLGICPFLGVSKNVKTAAGMGGAVIFVITIASAVTNLLYTYVIKKLGIEYLNTIIFILVIAALVQFEKSNAKASPIARRIFAAHHNQLRGARRCADQCSGVKRFHYLGCDGIRHSLRFCNFNYNSCRNQREN